MSEAKPGTATDNAHEENPGHKPRPEHLPDRLCVNPKSPYYNQDVLDHEVGIRFNGVEKTNVEEYCVSEGWVRLSAGKAKDRHGNAMTVKLKGKVEPYFK